MSLPFLFHLHTYHSPILIDSAFGSYAVRGLSSTAKGVPYFRQSASSTKERGSSSKLPLLYHHYSSCVTSSIIHFRQTGSQAFPSNLSVGLRPNTKLYHTGAKAQETTMLHRWRIWSLYLYVRRRQIRCYFGLWWVFRIFDGLLFHGLLGNRVVLRWVEAPTEKLDRPSRLL